MPAAYLSAEVTQEKGRKEEAIRVEAIAIRVEATAIRVEAITI